MRSVQLLSSRQEYLFPGRLKLRLRNYTFRETCWRHKRANNKTMLDAVHDEDAADADADPNSKLVVLFRSLRAW